MEYKMSLNNLSTDKRVAELKKLCEKVTFTKKLYFVEPRAELPANASDYDYIFGYSRQNLKNYVCLSDDEIFIQENNYLTALAMKEILDKKFKLQKPDTTPLKVLVMGWGKLTTQLEKVLTNVDIHILNFNHHKVPELMDKYGNKAYFETAPLKDFPVIINTIPKQVIRFSQLSAKSVIYELASPPYGINFDGADKQKYKYEILPGLPGKYYPDRAAKAVFDCIMRFMEKQNSRPTIALCITGSSCSYLKLLPILKNLGAQFDIIPVLSPNANLPNRFTDIEKFCQDIRQVCGHNIITTIAGAETLSSNKKIMASVVFPATGNTIAKLANGITDTCVIMAVKALLRNSKPCIIGMSTNDALSGNASNIGALLNRKHYYFVPFGQDDPLNKPYSMVCDFSKVGETIEEALKGNQIQPILN